MVKRYGFLWHVDVQAMVASNGGGGYSIESAETEMATEAKALAKLKEWFETRKENCSNRNCEHTALIEEDLTPDSVMSGMTRGMVIL